MIACRIAWIFLHIIYISINISLLLKKKQLTNTPRSICRRICQQIFNKFRKLSILSQNGVPSYRFFRNSAILDVLHMSKFLDPYTLTKIFQNEIKIFEFFLVTSKFESQTVNIISWYPKLKWKKSNKNMNQIDSIIYPSFSFHLERFWDQDTLDYFYLFLSPNLKNPFISIFFQNKHSDLQSSKFTYYRIWSINFRRGIFFIKLTWYPSFEKPSSTIAFAVSLTTSSFICDVHNRSYHVLYLSIEFFEWSKVGKKNTPFEVII